MLEELRVYQLRCDSCNACTADHDGFMGFRSETDAIETAVAGGWMRAQNGDRVVFICKVCRDIWNRVTNLVGE